MYLTQVDTTCTAALTNNNIAGQEACFNAVRL